MFYGMVLTDYFLLCEPFFAKKDKLFLPKVLYAAFGRWRRPFLKQGVLNRKGRPKAAHDISSTNMQIYYDAYYTFLIHSIIPFIV